MVRTRTLALLAFFTSFASMSYELVIAQTLSLLTDELVWWESCTIGFFIAATGLGVFLYEKVSKTDLLRFFLKAESLLALLGLASLPFILLMHVVYRIYIADFQAHAPFYKPLNWIMLACQSPNLLIGLLSGFELRVLFELLSSKPAQNKDHKQVYILVIYHFGALFASLLFALCLRQKIDPFHLAFLASLLNAGVCFWCLNKLSIIKLRTQVFGAVLALSLYGTAQWFWKDLRTLQVQNFYYNSISGIMENGTFKQSGPVGLQNLKSWSQSLPKVQRQFSSYQVIDIVHGRDDAGEWKLFLDGHFQFSTKTERFYHETLAHVPVMISAHRPEKVLILGGGDGLLLRELLKYKVQEIHLVEIDPEILQLGKSLPFTAINANSLSDQRVQISVADAFAWLRQSSKRFDAIYIDFPYPYTFEGLRVYSTEFLSLAARHLDSEGFIVMDIPLFGAGDPNWKAHASSLLSRSGFSKALAFEGAFGESFILAVKKEAPLLFAFRDMGIDLETLNPQWFASGDKRIEFLSGDAEDVNSVLKPKRISLPDMWK